MALALNSDGEKSVLGLWIEQAEGAKFWLKVVNELKARGVNDILVAVVDGSRAFRGGHLGVPANRRADLHRASDQEQLSVCIVERSQGDPTLDQSDLPGGER